MLLISFGIDVIGGGGLFPSPNLLGWLAILFALLISLLVHYLIASVISKIWYMFKNKKANVANEAIS